MSDVTYDMLLKRIAHEAGPEFLALLDDYLSAKFKRTQAFCQAELEPELQTRNIGNLQQSFILQEVVRAGRAAGFPAEMPPTRPKGHHYAKIVLPSFVVGAIRLESLNWPKSKYAKDLGRMNEAFNPPTADLFEELIAGSTTDKIFMVIAVAENPLADGLPIISFAVPYSSLDGYHFQAHLEEIRLAALTTSEPSELEPLPILKKRLDDDEQGAKEA